MALLVSSPLPAPFSESCIPDLRKKNMYNVIMTSKSKSVQLINLKNEHLYMRNLSSTKIYEGNTIIHIYITDIQGQKALPG